MFVFDATKDLHVGTDAFSRRSLCLGQCLHVALAKFLPRLGIMTASDQCLARQAILNFRVEMMSCC